MSKDVDTKSALLVILFFVCLIACWAHFNSKSLHVDVPTYIKLNPAGNVVVNLGQSLYEVTPQGDDISYLEVADIGLSGVRGDFDFFSNGDLLLYVTSYQRTFQDNLNTYLRKVDAEREALDNEGFYRCNLVERLCTAFADKLPVFSRVFRLTLDHNDNVYIADTGRDRIFKLSSTGELLATLDTGLRFPNDLLWDQQALWQINTNHHELLELGYHTDTFGDRVSSFTVDMPGRRYPSDVEKAADGWFILSMDNGMARGKLGRYNHSGELIEQAGLQRGADPVSMIKVGSRLILPDLKNMRYWSVNTEDLSLVEPFSSPNIAAHLSRSMAEIETNKKICWIILFIGLVAFSVLAYMAIKSEMSAIDDDVQAFAEDSQETLDMPAGAGREYWLPKSRQFSLAIKTMRWYLPLMWTLVACYFLYAVFFSERLNMLLSPLLFIVPTIYFTQKLFSFCSGFELGIGGKLILVKDSDGSVSIGKGSEVAFSNSLLCIDQTFIPIKQVDIDEYERWVKPRLRHAERISEIKMMVRQWRCRHPLIILPVQLVVMLFIAYMIWMII